MEEVKEISVEEAKRVLDDAAKREEEAKKVAKEAIQKVLDEHGFILAPMFHAGIMNGEYGVQWDWLMIRKKDN